MEVPDWCIGLMSLIVGCTGFFGIGYIIGMWEIANLISLLELLISPSAQAGYLLMIGYIGLQFIPANSVKLSKTGKFMLYGSIVLFIIRFNQFLMNMVQTMWVDLYDDIGELVIALALIIFGCMILFGLLYLVIYIRSKI